MLYVCPEKHRVQKHDGRSLSQDVSRYCMARVVAVMTAGAGAGTMWTVDGVARV